MADALAAHIAIRRGELAIDVELACPAGITCVMGPSGAGKSTILAAIAGLLVPDRGQITLGDEVWLDRARGVDVPVHERRLAYVFQGLALFPHMSAQGNVEYALHDRPRIERARRARELLERVGVGALAARRPQTFSGGEAQRVAIARAIAREPRLMLFDEPFTALDRELRAQLVTLVRELVTELGVPLVHVTHSEAEAELLGGRIIRIARGRVVVGAAASPSAGADQNA